MNSIQQTLSNFTDIEGSPLANLTKAGAKKAVERTKAAVKSTAPYALAGVIGLANLFSPQTALQAEEPRSVQNTSSLLAANIPNPRSSDYESYERSASTEAKVYKSLSENPVYENYKENVAKLVDKALPQNIPNRGEYVKILSNATTNLVFKGPESFKTDWEYSNYINGIFEKAYKSFNGDADKFGSMTTTVSYLQGTRASEDAPSRRAVFTREQLDRLFNYPDYNQSLKTIGSLNDGMKTYKLSPEVLRTKYSDRYIDKYLVTSR